MAKLRSVSTSFWSDPFVEELPPTQKLLFIYLITNEKTNMLGIYESSIKKISFETGLKKDDVSYGLKAFERVNKVKMQGNYIILINYMKHQNYNTNMKKSAIYVYNNLPNELKDSTLSIDKSNPLKGFERLLNHYGMVRKVEVEVEVEYKEEVKESFFSFDSFWQLYPTKVGKVKCQAKYEKIKEADRETIKNTLNNFIKHKPFESYTHPNPITYLNQERWNDELVKTKSANNNFVMDKF
tara:strand:+ start:391 stop:1110 length:720 start_codon:yes stop_codon:yes gene_type:complete